MSAGGVLIRLLQLSNQNELVFSLLLENVKTCVSTDACLMKIPLPFILFFFFFPPRSRNVSEPAFDHPVWICSGRHQLGTGPTLGAMEEDA